MPKQPESNGAGGSNIPIDEVVAAIRQLEYGQVLVKIHQGKIVGYEVTRNWITHCLDTRPLHFGRMGSQRKLCDFDIPVPDC